MEKMEYESFANIFDSKRVLVTGHTGFKGSWLALWLHDLGAHVTGLALNPETNPSHFELISLSDMVTSIEGDIRNYDMVNDIFESTQQEIVFHLAAQPLVRKSYDDPKGTFDTNIGGTINILEAARNSKSVKALIVITSDKCYENREWTWGYRENDPMGGHDPYSASKGAVEIVCSAYNRSFFSESRTGQNIGFATVRAGNVIGGGDWAQDRIIPDCVRALSAGNPIIIRNPNATRPWQHVLEPLSGYLHLAKNLLSEPDKYSGAWNFGPINNKQINVKKLAERFVEKWGDGDIIQQNPDSSKPHEANMLNLSIDKAMHKLGWFPILESSESIEWTADWYKNWFQRKNNIMQYSLDQIKKYSEIAINKNVGWTKQVSLINV